MDRLWPLAAPSPNRIRGRRGNREDAGADGSNMAVADANADPDEALIARIARGDERAFTEVVRRHTGRLRTLVRRFVGETGEADDIIQETFWTVWRKADSWKPGGPPFGAWLTRIAINRAIDADRRKRVRRFFGIEEADEVADSASSAEDVLTTRSELEAVATDIHDLPPRQRAAILLAAGGERSNMEIADAMGLSAGAVEQLLVRARRSLRARLTERDGAKETR
jgi:RNA polymerase sigma-70 factor, ECF subfamily